VGELARDGFEVICAGTVAPLAADAPVVGGRAGSLARGVGARGVALEAAADAVAAQRPAEQLAAVRGRAEVTRSHVPGAGAPVVREPQLAGGPRVVVAHQRDGDVARAERVLDQGAKLVPAVARGRLPAEPVPLAAE